VQLPEIRPLEVAGRLIGPGQPCFVAAEVGLNHNGDLDLAHRSIDAAADAGADGVKFQNFRTEDFLSDRSLTYEYVSQGETVLEAQYDMFKRYELPDDAWVELKRHCDERGVVFFSTPTSEAGIDQLVRLSSPLLKNGSDYLVHLPMVRAMARTGIPTVLSSGMSTLAEIDDAVRAFREAGGTELLLLHCTSSYPTPPEDVNLRRLPALAAAFGVPVGLSDHSWGSVAAAGSVAVGGCFVEKHFTLDKGLPGPDHRFSADPAELRELVDSVRTMEACLGSSVVGPTASESIGRRDYRLSCVAARTLEAGESLTEADIAFRRPATGLPPAALDWILGRPVTRRVAAGKPLEPADVC
jgi:N-acetylneuraminate synthase/N,N'-diacetyllegionaminate synthase